jgi:transposase
MEATGVYSLKLATCLSFYPDTQVSIVNPAQISFFAKAQLCRSKTDRIDAQVILAFAQSQHPENWRPDPESLQELSELVSQAKALRATLRQWDNRAYTQAYIPNLPKVVRRATNALQKAIRRELIKLEMAIKELCEDDPVLRSQIQLLCTIPGVAEQSAIRLLAYGKRALTGYSARVLVAHAGLAPKHRQSGSSILGKSHLAKEGDKRFRCILYMPTLVGIIHNPILKKFYQ